jgi:hypothetical protein
MFTCESNLLQKDLQGSWYLILYRWYDLSYHHHILTWTELNNNLRHTQMCIGVYSIIQIICQLTAYHLPNKNYYSQALWPAIQKVQCGHQIRGKSLIMNAHGKLKCIVLGSRIRQRSWKISRVDNVTMNGCSPWSLNVKNQFWGTAGISKQVSLTLLIMYFC